MSDEMALCQDKEPVEMCDHVCLLPDVHVEKGQPHFYGYRGVGAEIQRLTAELDACASELARAQAVPETTQGAQQ